MENFDIAKICSVPWKDLLIANPERSSQGKFHAGFLYIDCEQPFILAVQSVDSKDGNEFFHLCFIWVPEEIQKFLQGPYFPYNRPSMVSLAALVGQNVNRFLLEAKEFQKSAKTVVLNDNEDSIKLQREYKISFSGGGQSLSIAADDAIPMALLISFEAS